MTFLINKQIKNLPKEEQVTIIAATVQEEVVKTLTDEQKLAMASQPKLEMTTEKLEAIDSKLSVAPDGSKFINPEVRATLTETETTEINKALTNFNWRSILKREDAIIVI